jgi:hypothetical protein
MKFLKKICFLLMIFFCLPCNHGIADQFPGDQRQQEITSRNRDTLPGADGFGQPAEGALANLTPGERKWYHRFQEGIPCFDGWKKITQAVVEKFPEHERESRLAAMQALGFKVGYEWSRDNRVRKVNTDMLRAWGRELRKAGAENHVQLAQVLNKIDSEVDTLLRSGIAAQ